MSSILHALLRTPLVAVLRGIATEEVADIARALQQAGVRFIEVPFTSPNAAECLRRLNHAMANDNVYIGGGTILTRRQLDECIEAGGRYAVAPNTDPQIIGYARDESHLFIPGFFSPSEAIMAMQAGAPMLKLFPAHAISPSYVHSVRAVLPRQVPIMVTGSIAVRQAQEFLRIGCVLGLGSSIYRAGDRVGSVMERITPYMKLIKEKKEWKA